MSAVTRANGGDGWSSWSVARRGDSVLIEVTSSSVNVPCPESPSGWSAEVIFKKTITDRTGLEAISIAMRESSMYARRMSE